MARGTGKDHARWPLSLWGRDELLDLTPPAQHLLMVLWTHPDLSYCGAGEWHPGRIATRANGWTAAKVEQAGAELSAYSILIVDTDTDEFLIRFWIEEDGLWKQPNMAVSMANARAELASRTLRAVVVHEVLKIKAREPETSSWERQAVATLLSQKAIDPATLEPFTPTLTPVVTPTLIPGGTPTVTPGLTPGVTLSGGVGVDPTADPGPTPTPALSPTSGSFSKGGYVSGEPHLDGPLDLSNPPSPRCSKHRNAASDESCGACADARRARNDWDTAAKAERKRVRADCPDCDEYGWTIDETGQTTPDSVKCTHGAAVVSHA